MNGSTLGLWDIVDLALKRIGKGAAWFLIRDSGREEDGAGYVVTGSGLVCAVFGAAIGFVLSEFSRRIAPIEGAIFGGLIGACMGVFFGSFVEAVDGTINNLLNSLNSKIDGTSVNLEIRKATRGWPF
jgi:hypothetical protein